MASSLNRVELIGRLGKDVEVRNLSNGGSVANFSVATSETWKDKRSGERQEKTEWHNIVIWNENTVKFAEQYLKKGDLVRIEGQIQTRKWEDKDGNDRYTTEIVVPAFASISALMKLSFDNDNGNGRGGNDRDNDRGNSRGASRNRDDDSRDGNRSSSRSSRDDRDDQDRGRGRGNERDDRGGKSRAAAGTGRSNNDMDDEIPF